MYALWTFHSFGTTQSWTLVPDGISIVFSGIISFKNLASGFLKFGLKEKAKGNKKDHVITQETLTLFREELVQLIVEICTPSIPFTEKEV